MFKIEGLFLQTETTFGQTKRKAYDTFIHTCHNWFLYVVFFLCHRAIEEADTHAFRFQCVIIILIGLVTGPF